MNGSRLKLIVTGVIALFIFVSLNVLSFPPSAFAVGKATAQATQPVSPSTIPDSHTTPSGMTYIVMQHGNGRQPKAGEIVCVRLQSYGSNGVELERNSPNGDLFGVEMNDHGQWLPGLREALSHLQVGDKALVVLPPALIQGAYSTHMAEVGIPPNSSLVYFVDLVEVKNKDLLDLVSETIEEKGAAAAVEQYLTLKQEDFADVHVSEWETNGFGYKLMDKTS